MEKVNKTILVKKHLEEKGSITSWEAIEEYAATRLSAIIFNLRHRDNMNIISEEIDFTDKYGHKSTCAKYILEDGTDE